jgi:PPP family 3-phenylpropionic acid transporter
MSAAAGLLGRYGALSFTCYAAVGLFNPYAPVWFQSLGFSTLMIGTIASLQSWTRVLAPYAWSWLADHSGRRVELIRLAAAGALLASAALLGVRSEAWVAAVTALLFVANSGLTPLAEAGVVHALQTGAGLDAGRYGRVRVWGSLGFIVAVVGFGAVLDAFGVGRFAACVAAMNALLLLSALRLPVTREAGGHAGPGPDVLAQLRKPEVGWFFASVFFTVLAHTALYAFFSLYLVALGYGNTAIGVLWAVGVAAEIAFFWYQGRWFGRWPALRWLKAVAALTTLRFALVAAWGAWAPVLVLAQLAHALTFAGHHSACMALVDSHFPGRLRGRGQALYLTLGYGISGVVGGVGGGWLIGRHGHAAVFWAAAMCGLAAGFCVDRAGRVHALPPLKR